MNIFQRAFNAVTSPFRKAGPQLVANPRSSWMSVFAEDSKWRMPSLGTAEAQGELYQRLSWVQMAVKIISSSASSVPINVVQSKNERDAGIINHEFELLLSRPNPFHSRSEFLEATFAFRELTGNAYWWVNAATAYGKPIELWVIPPHQISPIPDGHLFIKGYMYRAAGEDIVIPVEEIVHFKQFNPNNLFIGLSPIEAVATVAVGDMKMQEWNTNYFAKDNAKPPGVLSFGNVDEPVWLQLQEQIKEKHGGTSRNMLMLRNVDKDNPVSWTSFGVSQKDMEFLSSREFTKEEILNIYGVPAGLMDKNSTEANATTAKAVFNEYKLWPTLVSVAETITNKILPRYGEGLKAEFEDVRPSDMQIELQQRETWKSYRTVDELRAADGLDPLPEGRGAMLISEMSKTPAAPLALEQPVLNQESKASSADAHTHHDHNYTVPFSFDSSSAKKALSHWKKKAKRLLDSAGVAECAFDSTSIPNHIKEMVEVNLKAVTTDEQLAAVFTAAKAGVEDFDKERNAHEEAVTKAIAKYFEEQQDRLKKVVERAASL